MCTVVVHRAVVWRGEWGQPRHSCIRWGFTCPKRKELFWGFFSVCTPIGLNGQNNVFFHIEMY